MSVGQFVSIAEEATEYISLQKAACSYSYSQEYLSLRARQGKLQAIKIGRSWFTTHDWLQKYISKAEDYKKLLERKSQTIAVEPPGNLPVYAPDADIWEDNQPEASGLQEAFGRKLQFGLASSLVGALFLVSVFLGQAQILRVAEKVSPAVISSTLSLQQSVHQKGFVVGSTMETHFVAGIGELTSDIGEIAKDYFTWLGDQIQDIARIFHPEPKQPVVQSLPPGDSVRGLPFADSARGLLVVPSSSDNVEEVKEQMKQWFSDEVNVTPYDEESGIITPVFRDRKGEDYLYILVPLKDKQ